MSHAELWVHFKQGDDLARHMKKNQQPEKALLAWAAEMERNVKRVKQVAKVLSKKIKAIEADTHYIDIEAEPAAINKAIKLGLLERSASDQYED